MVAGDGDEAVEGTILVGAGEARTDRDSITLEGPIDLG